MMIMPFLTKAAAAVGGTILLSTAALYSCGVVEVCVKEKTGHHHDGPSHIHLPLPALAGPIALHMIPARKLHHDDAKLHEWMPAIRAAAKELERCPDGTVLVEVIDARETVHITKSGGDLVIDVDNPQETVHVSFPISIAVSMTEQLDSAHSTI